MTHAPDPRNTPDTASVFALAMIAIFSSACALALAMIAGLA